MEVNETARKLISMTDFVLGQTKYIETAYFRTANIPLNKIHNYAKFLKQSLEQCMFVPCDENGNVLENKSCNFSCSPSDFSEKGKCGLNGCYEKSKQYQKAQERVLFEGFKVKGDFWLSNGELYIDEEFCENKTIEDLIDFDVTLTPNALKQLGL